MTEELGLGQGSHSPPYLGMEAEPLILLVGEL